MATRKYNLTREGEKQNVTEAVGSAISSGVVQITVDLAVATSRGEVLDQIDQIRQHILEGIWPPA
jgi:multidrug resistance efflux pump